MSKGKEKYGLLPVKDNEDWENEDLDEAFSDSAQNGGNTRIRTIDGSNDCYVTMNCRNAFLCFIVFGCVFFLGIYVVQTIDSVDARVAVITHKAKDRFGYRPSAGEASGSASQTNPPTPNPTTKPPTPNPTTKPPTPNPTTKPPVPVPAKNLDTPSPTVLPHDPEEGNSETPSPTVLPHDPEEENSETPSPTVLPHDPEEENSKTPSPTVLPHDPEEENGNLEEGNAKGKEIVKNSELAPQYGKTFTTDELKEFNKKQEVWKDRHWKDMLESIKYNATEMNFGNSQGKEDAYRAKECSRINEKTKREMQSKSIKMEESIMTKPLESGNSVKDLGFDPMFVKEQLRTFRKQLLDHYEIESEKNFVQMFDSFSEPTMKDPHRKDFIQSIADRFTGKIVNKKSFNFGVFGTSVMAGHDNCHYLSYGPTLQRTWERILAFAKIPVEVRNAGQNGDGSSVFSQLECGKHIMGDDVDIIQLGYWMINMVGGGDFERFLRRVMTMGPSFPVGHSLMPLQRKRPKHSVWEPYYKHGFFQLFESWSHQFCLSKNGKCKGVFNGDPPLFWWWRIGRHWGRPGDGRCHMKTREGYSGTYMQNWHPGPLGFQMMMDLTLFHYLEALMVSMDDIQAELNQLSGSSTVLAQLQKRFTVKAPSLPKPVSVNCEANPKHELCNPNGFPTICASGFHPRQDKNNSIIAWNKLAKDNPDPRNPETNSSIVSGGYRYGQVKRRSKIAGCGDKVKKIGDVPYKQFKPCSAHQDYGEGFTNSGDGWLTFQLPKMKLGEISVCFVNHGWKHNLSKTFISMMIDGKPFDANRFTIQQSCILLTDKAPRDVEKTFLSIKFRGNDKLMFVIVK